MGRVLDANADTGFNYSAYLSQIPIGGFVEAYSPGKGLVPVQTPLPRTEYPELDALYPFDGVSGAYFMEDTGLNAIAGASNHKGRILLIDNKDVVLVDEYFNSSVVASLPSEAESVVGVGYGGDRWVVVTYTRQVFYADEGAEHKWTQGSGLGTGSITGAKARIAYYDGRFVMTVNDDASPAFTSLDGATWTDVGIYTDNGGTGLNVTYSEDLGLWFVSTVSNGLFTSSDGTTWNKITGPGYDIVGLAAGHGGRVVSFTANGYIIYTDDAGTSWTYGDTPFNTSEAFYDACYDPTSQVWAAVGTSGDVAYSFDGEHFARIITSSTQHNDTIIHSGRGLFVVAETPVHRFHITNPAHILVGGDPAETRLVRVK